jgi:hypothetical protein
MLDRAAPTFARQASELVRMPTFAFAANRPM